MGTDVEYFGAEGFGVTKFPTPLTPVVRAGEFVFVSGLVPRQSNGKILGGDVEGQTRVIMENLGKALAEAGCGLGDVVKTTVYLQDPGDFAAFNTVYSLYFAEGKRPARTCVQNDMVIDIKVEIEAIAYQRGPSERPRED